MTHFDNIGMHVFKGKNMTQSIKENLDTYKFKVCQIFTHGPRSKNRTNIIYSDVKNINSKLYVHSSYITNPWGDIKKSRELSHTIDQFLVGQYINAKGVVLHIPKIDPVEVAMGTKIIADELKKNGVSLNNNYRIILEMKALKAHPTKSYENPKKINRLIKNLKKLKLTHREVGICIDTAHIYASQAQIRKYDETLKYLSELNNNWIYLIHLNGNEYDSKLRAGDKHAIPLSKEDKLWGKTTYKNSGCRAFLEYAKKNKIDVIIEAKSHHKKTQILYFLRKIKHKAELEC